MDVVYRPSLAVAAKYIDLDNKNSNALALEELREK